MFKLRMNKSRTFLLRSASCSRKVRDKRGVALFIVLATFFVIVILANVILNIMLSHSRLTHHQVSRIQAYYAAWAGVNYALEMLRSGGWTATNCPAPGGCLLSALDPQFGTIFPASITGVTIILISPGPGVAGCDTNSIPAGVNACVQATATYPYYP